MKRPVRRRRNPNIERLSHLQLLSSAGFRDQAMSQEISTRSWRRWTPRWTLQGALRALLEREAHVYRGHEGVRQWVRDIDEVLADIRLELPEIRDVGDRLVAIGRSAHVARQAEPRSSRHSVAWSSGEMARRLGF